MRREVAVVVGALALSGSARAEVLFQNTGVKAGFQSVFTQKAGTIEEVTSPVYKGTSAIKATQTYQSSDGANYHSEVIHRMAQLAGQDLYYGQAVYLPPDWVWHNQNVCFQQWAPEMPEAPWILMYLQNDKLRLGGRGQMGDTDITGIGDLRGTWMRIITRIKMANPGIFEVWLNDKKVYSRTGNVRAMGPSLRWSSGIYATRWDTEKPLGPHVLSIFHDNLRVATTYDEADPAKWGDGDPTPTDGGSMASADAGVATEPDAGEAMGGAGGSAGGAGGSGGASGAGGSGGSGGRGGASPTGDTGGATGEGEGGSAGEAPNPHESSGCSFARHPDGGGLVLIAALAALFLRSSSRPRAGRRRRPGDRAAG